MPEVGGGTGLPPSIEGRLTNRSSLVSAPGPRPLLPEEGLFPIPLELPLELVLEAQLLLLPWATKCCCSPSLESWLLPLGLPILPLLELSESLRRAGLPKLLALGSGLDSLPPFLGGLTWPSFFPSQLAIRALTLLGLGPMGGGGGPLAAVAGSLNLLPTALSSMSLPSG